MCSSDEDVTGHLENWLRSKLEPKSSRIVNDDMMLDNLSSKELKKLNEKQFEQSMEDALEELDDLDDISQKRAKVSEKCVTFGDTEVKDLEADSGEAEEESSEGPDPLYDPEADAEDEAWVEKQRSSHYPKQVSAGSGQNAKKSPKAPLSDAILSCPACMTILCIDCQRHEMYTNQFRAMFVMNCSVVFDEILTVSEKLKRDRKRKSKFQKSEKDSSDSGSNILAAGMNCRMSVNNSSNSFSLSVDQFHPVKCGICTTEVAVYDKDEIYHFFNAIASLP